MERVNLKTPSLLKTSEFVFRDETDIEVFFYFGLNSNSCLSNTDGLDVDNSYVYRIGQSSRPQFLQTLQDKVF